MSPRTPSSIPGPGSTAARSLLRALAFRQGALDRLVVWSCTPQCPSPVTGPCSSCVALNRRARPSEGPRRRALLGATPAPPGPARLLDAALEASAQGMAGPRDLPRRPGGHGGRPGHRRRRHRLGRALCRPHPQPRRRPHRAPPRRGAPVGPQATGHRPPTTPTATGAPRPGPVWAIAATIAASSVAAAVVGLDRLMRPEAAPPERKRPILARWASEAPKPPGKDSAPGASSRSLRMACSTA